MKREKRVKKILISVIIVLSLIIIANANQNISPQLALSKNIFYPNETVIITANFKPNESAVISPVGLRYNLSFEENGSTYTAYFPLKKDVVIGNYTVIADGLISKFAVDYCTINGHYSEGMIFGEIRYYVSKPEVKYSIDGVEKNVELANGLNTLNNTFQIPIDSGKHSVAIECGNSILEMELEVNFSVEVKEDRVYALLDGKKVPANLTVYAGSEVLNFEDEFKIEELKSRLKSNVSQNISQIKVVAVYKHLSAERTIRISITSEEERKEQVEEERVEGIKEVFVGRKIYFPGESIAIFSNFEPETSYLIDPAGNKIALNFSRVGDRYLSVVELKKSVVLGEWIVFVDGIEKEIVVDSYSITATFDGERIVGNVKYYFIEPDILKWKIESEGGVVEKGFAKIKDGRFEIKPKLKKGHFKATLKCYNSILFLEFDVERLREVTIPDVAFVNEEVKLESTFLPNESYLLDPNLIRINLTFQSSEEGYEASFVPKDVGIYRVVVDEFNLTIAVDDYSITAVVKGHKIVGNISWNIVKPPHLRYTIKEMGFSGRVKVKKDGSFSLNLKRFDELPVYTILLKCGNSVASLQYKPLRKVEKIVAYDPVRKVVVIKEGVTVDFEIKSIAEHFEEFSNLIDKIHKPKEMELPADPEILRRYNIDLEVLKTKINTKKLREDLIRVEISNKLETWYRFSVKIPEGYRVKEIVGDDGRRIVNNIQINRTTGEIEGDLRWYVENGTLYFYDDPIWGYNVSLQPPQPNRSIAIELANSGTNAGGGQISAIVFPYSQGDDSATITLHDHVGRTEDSGYGNDIDINAGSKIAIRYNNRQFGNPYSLFFTRPLGDDYINHLSRTDVQLNSVPNGELESVIITEMQTPLWGQRQVNITQKVIIRDNNLWFATVYYIENVGTRTLSDLRFFQGMDWNFRGSYTSDNSYYDSNSDIVYGYDANAPPNDIQYGGFSSINHSSQHDVDSYITIWRRIDSNSLTNSSSYIGDAGTALAWDRATLNPGEKWVIPIIWGLGYDFNNLTSTIDEGKSKLYDVGVVSINNPANNSKFNPATAGVVNFNATIGLFGVVDVENVPVIFNISKVGGGFSYEDSTFVSLSVPFNESVEVSFPYNLSSLSYGTYKVTFRTQLQNDQNTTNDEKFIYISVVAFTVEPDQENTSDPGSEVFYTVYALNYVSEDRFDINITQSTKGWTTRLYNSSQVIAEDTDGDGSWDFVLSGYDTNSNSIPDIFLPFGNTSVVVSKVIPESAPLGERDLTTLNFTSLNASTSDEVNLNTSTPLPPTKNKEFYLHSNNKLNTSIPSSAVVQIAGFSQESWYQDPPFANGFVVYDEIDINLWLSSPSSSTHEIVVTLISTDGVNSNVIGTQSRTISLSPTPSLQVFTLNLTSPFEFSKNEFAVLRIENKVSDALVVNLGSTTPSNITFNTTTYVKVAEIFGSCIVGDQTNIFANVTDPIGSYDIVDAKIDIYYSNGTLYQSGFMDLNSVDPDSPSLWKLFNYTFSAQSTGVYIVNVTSRETNGVNYTLSSNLTCNPRKTIVGRVLEDFYPLGINNGEDIGIENASVFLFKDDGDGVLDFDDKIYLVSKTNQSGYYSFPIADTSSEYFVVVNSETVNSTLGANSKAIWAEQTYQTQWNGSGWGLTKKFGGRYVELSDIFGIRFEHAIKLNLSNYQDELIDFGFSFETIVNVRDSKDSIKAVGEVFIINNVSESWKKVYLHNYYAKPVVVCTYNLPSNTDPPAVVRIRNVDSYSFEVKIQNPGDTDVPMRSNVHCIVMEEGKWELEDGRRVEAYRVLSDGTNENNNWDSSLMEQVTYNWSYSNPVVLGQVMSYNDTEWSVFWDSDGNRLNPPDSANLYVGKHVGEDSNTGRASETVGYIVVEAGSGVVNGIKYSAQLGSDSIRGVGNAPPYIYDLGDTYSIGIAIQSAMDGANGGWAVLYGPNPVSGTLNLAIDEDTISDSERSHITEQVAYWVFNKSGVLTAKVNSDKFCQGCLRQFIVNANAITGKQRSYFVMQTTPNSQDLSGSWWTITLNQSLGPLPTIVDEIELNGTVLTDSMAINDTNPACVQYDYTTQSLVSSTCTSIPVGIGEDGVPFSGDEDEILAIPKPEIEIYGNSIVGSVINITANNSKISNLSLFGANTTTTDYWNYGFGIKVGSPDQNLATNLIIENIFAGLRANGANPLGSGLSINEYVGVGIYSNNTEVRDSISAYNGGTGIFFWGRIVNSGLVENTISFSNGIRRENADGISMEGWVSGGYDSRARNIIVNTSIASKNAGFGVDSWFGKERLVVINSTIEYNGAGQERGGIRILSNYSIVKFNLIRENYGSGVVIGRMANYSTYGNLVFANSIYNNSKVGIDIDPRLNYENSYDGDNVTLNDGLNPSHPNYGLDYPTIASAKLISNTLEISGEVNISSGRVDIYLVRNQSDGDDLVGNNFTSVPIDDYHGEGWVYLGSLAVNSGNFSGSIDVTGKGVENGAYISAVTVYDNNTSEFSPNYYLFNYRNLTAVLGLSYSGNFVNITISVTAHNRTQTGIYVYWNKPDNLSISSMSGDYTSSGSDGSYYWWSFNTISLNETKHIFLNLTSTGEYSVSSAYNLGVDPR